jgi:hypothetical protein
MAHLLRRAGYDEAFIADVARIMEYSAAYELYRDDRLVAAERVAISGPRIRRGSKPAPLKRSCRSSRILCEGCVDIPWKCIHMLSIERKLRGSGGIHRRVPR